MLVAQDFRDRARIALSGNWALGVGTGFIASLLGAYTALGGGSSSVRFTEKQNEYLSQLLPIEVYVMVMGVLEIALIISLIYTIAVLIIGGPVSLGYVKFNLHLTDGRPAGFTDLFSQFHRFGEGFLVYFLRLLYTFLWTMLFTIPCVIAGIIVMVVLMDNYSIAGIYAAVFAMLLCLVPAIILGTMKTYSYAMAPYLLYENPGMGANWAIQKSVDLMRGNKWRLFCLAISFIGWAILCCFTLGIGFLWLKPYQEAAYAVFYREIKRERYGEPVNEQYGNPYEQDKVYQEF